MLFPRRADERRTVADCGIRITRIPGVPHGRIEKEAIEVRKAQDLQVEKSFAAGAVECGRVHFAPHGAAGLLEDVCPHVGLEGMAPV